MIKITNLHKRYEIKGYEPVDALNNINITLPDKGLVFIVGKSGSGKSTLLNLIGSLDKATNGEIIADNIDVCNMDETTSSLYRNNYVGFIFQDCCLINTLNVEDNVLISLDIKDERDINLVNETLKMVDLEGFNKRFPNSLSAGQKQRVAIARGYIKRPKLLLCDEPTGNLDSKTSKQVLKILKELSKDTLVVIVSHNIDDAYHYGDRIIEIADGEIVNDLTNVSDQNSYEINDKKLYVNSLNNLSDEQLKDINKKIESGEIKSIRPHNELFKKKDENYGEMQSFSLKNRKYGLKKKIGLSWKFQKKKMVSTIITSTISAILMVLFGLCQFFTAFSLNDVMQKSFTNGEEKVLALKKAHYKDKRKNDITTSDLVAVTDEDLSLLKNSDYKGNTYTLYDYALPISLKSWSLLLEGSINDSSNLKEFFAQESYGVLTTNEQFLEHVFGTYSYVGNPTEKDYGIIITDYIADSILFHRTDAYSSYEDILGTYRNKDHSTYAYINAIINTGYKQRYQGLINKFIIYYQSPKAHDLQDIMLSDEYLHFYEEIKSYLAITYSLNPNFVVASKDINARNIFMLTDTQFEMLGHEGKDGIDVLTSWATIDSEYGYDLPNNTLGISLETFKGLLDLPETTSIEDVASYNGTQLTINKFRRFHNQPEGEPVCVKNVSIQIIDNYHFDYLVSDDLFSYLRDYDVIPYSLYLDDLATAPKAYAALKDVPFVPRSSYIEAGIAINNVVIIFDDFFLLISIIMLVGIMMILGFHTLINITQRKYDIGVLKALGMKNKDIASIYVMQILFSTILIVLLFIIGLVIFTNVANAILFKSFMRYLKNPALRSINILSFNPWIMLLDITIILVVNVLITLIPFIAMKKVEPLGIIRKSNQ